MEKFYKFRIYPDEGQKEYINHNFYCVCFVYNYFLELKTKMYNQSGIVLGLKECNSKLTTLKHTEPYKFLEEADSTALQQVIIDLYDDFQVFFNKKTKNYYPKFKKKIDVNSFRVEKKESSDNICFSDGYVKIPKIEKIRLGEDEEIPEDLEIHFATVSKTPNDEYYITIT